jgi:hypothetical protein
MFLVRSAWLRLLRIVMVGFRDYRFLSMLSSRLEQIHHSHEGRSDADGSGQHLVGSILFHLKAEDQKECEEKGAVF